MSLERLGVDINEISRTRRISEITRALPICSILQWQTKKKKYRYALWSNTRMRLTSLSEICDLTPTKKKKKENEAEILNLGIFPGKLE